MLCSAGFDNAGFDRCAISLFASRPGRLFKIANSVSSRRRSAIVEIVLAISKPGACARRQLQAESYERDTGWAAANSGGRYVSPLASTAHAMRANLLAAGQLPQRCVESLRKAFRSHSLRPDDCFSLYLRTLLGHHARKDVEDIDCHAY